MSSPPPPPQYKQVSDSAYSMPGFKQLTKGDACEIVEINGDKGKLKHKDLSTFSQGPFIEATIKSIVFPPDDDEDLDGDHSSKSVIVIVTKDGKEITQEDINGYASFYFVVKGGKTTTFSGGRKSRRLNSKKNKRTRRKSLKKQHRRRK